MRPGLHTILSATLVASLGLASTNASAAVGSAFANFTGISVLTTGTASVTFTESPFDVFSAFAITDGGVDDAFNDNELFASQVSALGEATATNGTGGLFTNSQSFAQAEALPGDTNTASANTTVELEMELSGAGMITLNLDYDLSADTLGALPGGFAAASIDAWVSAFASGPSDILDGEVRVEVLDSTGFDDAFGTLALQFAFDDLGLGPQLEFLTVQTFADVNVSAVPVPAAALMFAPALLGMAGLRRRRV